MTTDPNRHLSPAQIPAMTPANYWKQNCRLTLLLLTIWFGGTFCTVFFARELDRVRLFGWPLSFYMAAQGVLLIYLAIVLTYTIRMHRADRQFSDQSS